VDVLAAYLVSTTRVPTRSVLIVVVLIVLSVGIWLSRRRRR
jgi:hypothetical protein